MPAEASGVNRLLLLGLGHTFFFLGMVGVFLPVLPTTVFWIGAAWCFARSAPKLRDRLFAWPVVGETLSDLYFHGVMKRPVKRAAIAGMMFVSLLSILIAQPPLPVVIVITSIILTVAAYITLLPERQL